MIHDLWAVSGFSPVLYIGPVLCIGTVIAVANHRRRAWRMATEIAFTPADDDGEARHYAAPSIEAAERQLGILLRRMRSHLQAPYDFATSRIANAADFERCLDLATGLYLRLGELSGAPIATSLERERVRDQVLLSLASTPGLSAAAVRLPP